MDTKRILVFAAGVAVGYFLFKEMNKQKQQVAPPAVGGAAPPVTGEAGVNPYSAPCQQALMDSMMTMRFSSPEGQKEYEDQFMSDCFTNPSQYLTTTA